MERCQAAVTHVRSQAAAVRKTTAEYLKGELLRGERLTNGEPQWSSILSGFHVTSYQVAELAEEIDPVLSFFAFQPLRATAKPGDVPTFLSTKLMPRNDNDNDEAHGEDDAQDGSRDRVEAVERFNSSVDGIYTSFQGAAGDVLGNLMFSPESSTR